jgi:hypothetical protein
MNSKASYDWKDIAERAAWTFVQTFLSVILVVDLGGGLDLAILQQAATAGVAAALVLLKEVAKAKGLAPSVPLRYRKEPPSE